MISKHLSQHLSKSKLNEPTPGLNKTLTENLSLSHNRTNKGTVGENMEKKGFDLSHNSNHIPVAVGNSLIKNETKQMENVPGYKILTERPKEGSYLEEFPIEIKYKSYKPLGTYYPSTGNKLVNITIIDLGNDIMRVTVPFCGSRMWTKDYCGGDRIRHVANDYNRQKINMYLSDVGDVNWCINGRKLELEEKLRDLAISQYPVFYPISSGLNTNLMTYPNSNSYNLYNSYISYY